MGGLATAVTLSEGSGLYTLLMYVGAVGVFALLVAFNRRPLLELLRDGRRIARRR
jgi:hypothetical protein